MDKYTECHNCENKSDCERTYLGGCTDGEEKKLTDEEIVKALENCQKDRCEDCPYFIDEHNCKANSLLQDALNLIYRLDSESESISKREGEIVRECVELKQARALLKAELKNELAEHEEFTKKAKEHSISFNTA